MQIKKLVFIISIIFLAACAEPIIVFIPPNNNTEDSNKPKPPPPPLKTAKTQSGVASFYADKFQGLKTASGEVYDKNKLTAAHKELPFGTKVKVTNRKNRKTVTVVINDRLPLSNSRIIDLSKAAAQQIDMIQDGIVQVDLLVIE